VISQLNAQLARVAIDERLQIARGEHRDAPVRTHAMPIVREIPRPVRPDALDTSTW
jgi:hypothetical protein